MKILYAIQGTGNGHISRAKEIIPILKLKGNVDILISGNQCEIKLPFIVKYQFDGIGFTFGKKGGIDFWQTLKSFKFKQFYSDIKSLPIEDYDLIINDFEPVSAWAAKLKRIPIISLSHQNAVFDRSSPKYGFFKLEKYILKYYAPSKVKFGFHFKAYSSAIFTPIIRQEIRIRKVKNKGHYTVYLPAYSDKKIIKVLSEFSMIKWHVFSKNSDKHQLKKNISIFPIDETSFTKSLVSCEGVLCGAGFETPAEALFLQKKLLVIPMKNQYEQQCNALALKDLGITVLRKFNKSKVPQIQTWLFSNKTIKVSYPDVTEEIMDALMMPNYREILISTTG